MEQKTRGDGTKKVIDSLPPLPQLTLALAYKIAARASTASSLTPLLFALISSFSQAQSLTFH